MVCRTNLKANIDRILESRSNVPNYIPPRKEDAILPNALQGTVSNGRVKQTQAVFSSIPLFSAGAAFNEDDDNSTPLSKLSTVRTADPIQENCTNLKKIPPRPSGLESHVLSSVSAEKEG